MGHCLPPDVRPLHAERARPGHLGLIGMRERARAIGAVLELGAAAEGGTRMGVSWTTPS